MNEQVFETVRLAFLLVYLIGVIVSMWLALKLHCKTNDCMTLAEFFVYVVLSLSSWMFGVCLVLSFFLYRLDDVVIWKCKKK